ncbi:hypothetical protein [Streptomyces sp. NPDC058297]|uniref:hypothetical protein n=1 Tax=Streptomyces sp. NPDC058297 TaxID=3346433 RepID=UPI0036F0DE05
MFVLVEDAAQAFTPAYVEAGDLPWIGDHLGQRVWRSGLRDALMGPIGVVEPLELPQNVAEVALVPDQRAVQQLTPTGLHPVPLGNTIPALACSFSTRGNSLNGAWDDPSMSLSIVTTLVRNLIKVPSAVLRSRVAKDTEPRVTA